MPPAICGRSAARLRWGFARLPSPASAMVDAERTSNCRLVRPPLPCIAIAIRPPPSNHDGGCPLNLTPGRRFYDRWMNPLRRKRDRFFSLSLPVADAAGLARPFLDPRVHGLRVERVAVTPRYLRSRRDMRLRDVCLLHLAGANMGSVFDHGLAARRLHFGGSNNAGTVIDRGLLGYLRSVAARLDRNRREFRGRTESLWRQHRLRKIKAEEFFRAVLIGQGRTGAGHEHRRED